MAITDHTERAATRVPPHSEDAEASVLGALFLSTDAIEAVLDVGLDSSDFYKPQWGHLYGTILALHGRGEPVDVTTVGEALRRDGGLDTLTITDVDGWKIEGAAVLGNLIANTPATTSKPVARYAGIIKELAQLRRLIGVAAEITELGYSNPDSVTDAIDQAEQLLFALTDTQHRAATSIELTAAYDAHLDLLEDRAEGRIPLGAPTGLHDLDALLTGLAPGQLIVPCARPSIGKTAFGLAVAYGVAKAGTPTAFYSIEMSHDEILDRLVASSAGVDFDLVRKGRLTLRDWELVTAARARIDGMPLHIIDDPTATVADIRAAARRHVRHGLGVLVIDYLQKIQPRKGSRAENRQVEVGEITRGIKTIGREMGIAVVCLAQLNRSLEARADKRPQLSDLRESGEIEQEADVVIGLYRDEMYRDDSPDRGVLEAGVIKHRNGPTGVARLAFDGRTQRVRSMSRHD